MRHRTNKNKQTQRALSAVIIVVICIAALLAVRQGGSLTASLQAIVAANGTLVIAAISVFAVHFLCAAGTYYLLATKPLRFWRTVTIALAGAFAGKLLPAGAGGMTLYFLYLRKNKYSPVQAGSVIATNNILGATMHALLLLSAFAFGAEAALPSLSVDQLLFGAVLVGLVVLALLFAARRTHIGSKVRRARSELTAQIQQYRNRPWRLVLAACTSLGVTITYTATLYFSAHAVGVDVSPATALAIFSVGAAATGLAPTPAGLGAVEAGLVAAFIGFGITAAPAVAAVLVYRLISFWVPFGIGALTLLLARRAHYV